METEAMRQELFKRLGFECTTTNGTFYACLSGNLVTIYSPESPSQHNKILVENKAVCSTYDYKRLQLQPSSTFTYLIGTTKYTAKILRNFNDVCGKSNVSFELTASEEV